jgi:hypothetical protein
MNPRKIIIRSLTAVAALLTGCAADEPLFISDGTAISFGAPAAQASRAVSLDKSSLQETGFGVFAYYTEQTSWANAKGTMSPNFMNNQRVTYDGSWKYSPTKYWPKSETDNISYFACAPYNGNISVAANGAPVVKYSIVKNGALDSDAMCDLVAARCVDVHSKTHPDRTVDFNFNHTLSRVSIKARSTAANHTIPSYVYITDISLYGINASGNLNLEDSSWSGVTAADSYVSLAAIGNFANQVVGTINKNTIKVDSTTPMSLLKSDEYLFLIPQSEAMTIRISYDIVAYDSSLNTHTVTHFDNVEVATGTALQQGKSYTFTLNITPKSVSLDDGSGNWDEQEDNSVEASDQSFYLYGADNKWWWEGSQYEDAYKMTYEGNGNYSIVIAYSSIANGIHFSTPGDEANSQYSKVELVCNSHDNYYNLGETYTNIGLKFRGVANSIYVNNPDNVQYVKITLHYEDNGEPINTAAYGSTFEVYNLSVKVEAVTDIGYYVVGDEFGWTIKDSNRMTSQGNGVYTFDCSATSLGKNIGFTRANWEDEIYGTTSGQIVLGEWYSVAYKANDGHGANSTGDWKNVRITLDLNNMRAKVEQR